MKKIVTVLVVSVLAFSCLADEVVDRTYLALDYQRLVENWVIALEQADGPAGTLSDYMVGVFYRAKAAGVSQAFLANSIDRMIESVYGGKSGYSQHLKAQGWAIGKLQDLKEKLLVKEVSVEGLGRLERIQSFPRHDHREQMVSFEEVVSRLDEIPAGLGGVLVLAPKTSAGDFFLIVSSDDAADHQSYEILTKWPEYDGPLYVLMKK